MGQSATDWHMEAVLSGLRGTLVNGEPSLLRAQAPRKAEVMF
jgi:hypothetical protein